MSETFHIRPAVPGDAAAVVTMMGELSAHEGKPPPEFGEAQFRRDGFGPDAAFTCLIAEAGNGPLGYALFHPAYDCEKGLRGSYLYDFYVAAAARRQGIGRALLAAVCRSTAQSGGGFVWWCMERDNELAARFYRRFAELEPNTLVWDLAGRAFAQLAES